MRNRVLVWELLGILFISLLGSLLHFVFDWSGGFLPVALVAAVNESVWEHLKLGVWPALFYSLIEYRYLKQSTNNFIVAKAICIYLIPISIVVLFYSYTFILGHGNLIMDILIFYVAIIIGQLVSYKFLTKPPLYPIFSKVALAAIIALFVVFVAFTFYPPHLDLFRDPITGTYGVWGFL
ncbi:MAG: DUF6512 family protein [Candidatus Freyarchaeota archaeon]